MIILCQGIQFLLIVIREKWWKSFVLWFMMQASVQAASVKGLKGRKTLNKDPDPKNPLEGKEERFVAFIGMLLL